MLLDGMITICILLHIGNKRNPKQYPVLIILGAKYHYFPISSSTHAKSRLRCRGSLPLLITKF